MRRFALLVASLGCVTAPVSPKGPLPHRARGTFENGYLIRIDVEMPEGGPIVLRPSQIHFAVGRAPVVRLDPARPPPRGIVVRWAPDARELWVGEVGEVFLEKLEGTQTGVPAQWIGDLAGRLTARIAREGDGAVRTLDFAFEGGIYNAGASAVGY